MGLQHGCQAYKGPRKDSGAVVGGTVKGCRGGWHVQSVPFARLHFPGLFSFAFTGLQFKYALIARVARGCASCRSWDTTRARGKAGFLVFHGIL